MDLLKGLQAEKQELLAAQASLKDEMQAIESREAALGRRDSELQRKEEASSAVSLVLFPAT